MDLRRFASLSILIITVGLAAAGLASAQNVKRLVIIKIDGLPGYYVDRFARQRDPVTGRSVLPWFDEVFYKNGTRVPNFYTRGMSLSGPSWGQLDTGQHLQIKGNVEYDRFTLHAYDYLNFLPYYIKYRFTTAKADMPAVEVLDELKIPLLSDVFDYEKRYTAQQLYQRGNNWEVVANGFVHLYPGNVDDFIDEWTLGLDLRKVPIDQNERDILGKLVKRPHIDYFDYYDGSFDHVSHHNNDTRSRLAQLKVLDTLVGRMWTAIQGSSRADETALVLVSDHGFNSDEKVYSQGFNLVKMLTSSAGGGHHVVTKRRLMLDYSIKGIYPLIPLIRTASANSTYLEGQAEKYPTALLDFDGNERSSIHLRNSDLNVLHVLLQQLKGGKLSPPISTAATNAFFEVIDQHRVEWRKTIEGLTAELNALDRWIEPQKKIVATQPKKFTPEETAKGADKEARRVAALTDLAIEAEGDYRKYLATLTSLVALDRKTFDARKVKIEDLISPGAMGDANTAYQLQNYVVGPSAQGLVLGRDNRLDMSTSFARIDYFKVLHEQRVRNNVQEGISNRPVDFVAVRLPSDAVASALPEASEMSEDPIWIYDGEDRQALILSRSIGGEASYRYVPISGLKQADDGKITFKLEPIGAGFPLKYFEDPELAVPPAERADWFANWHAESDWLNAIHRTKYSNGLIGLNEQLDSHPVLPDGEDETSDDALIRHFRQRQRRLTEADLLILANDHWNFDVRGFNPGGNHGSFFRASTNSTFMVAGGASTGIPRGLVVERPYDSLSFASTMMRLLGKIDSDNRPNPDLAKRGFKRFPGPVVREITGDAKPSASR